MAAGGLASPCAAVDLEQGRVEAAADGLAILDRRRGGLGEVDHFAPRFGLPRIGHQLAVQAVDPALLDVVSVGMSGSGSVGKCGSARGAAYSSSKRPGRSETISQGSSVSCGRAVGRTLVGRAAGSTPSSRSAVFRGAGAMACAGSLLRPKIAGRIAVDPVRRMRLGSSRLGLMVGGKQIVGRAAGGLTGNPRRRVERVRHAGNGRSEIDEFLLVGLRRRRA